MPEREYVVTVLCFACPQCIQPIPHYYQLPSEHANAAGPEMLDCPVSLADGGVPFRNLKPA
jgi:hypothetical protein